jgi:hypothetical protein
VSELESEEGEEGEEGGEAVKKRSKTDDEPKEVRAG